jgi:uncharacterized protein YcgI (DUF1989 family)
MTGKEKNDAMRLTVPGGYGRSIDVAEGRYVGVRDIKGGQCGDFWAIDAGDFDHYLAPSYTWVHLGRIQPRVGDELVTNRREPILTIIADDVGWHDMLVPACDKQRYKKYYGVTGHRNCRDNFLEAISSNDWGTRPVPQPFNLFMNTFGIARFRFLSILQGATPGKTRHSAVRYSRAQPHCRFSPRNWLFLRPDT